MKRLAAIGKGLVGLGGVCLFWREKGINGFGGYQTNTRMILIGSLTLLFLGLILIGYSKSKTKNVQSNSKK